MKIFKNKKGVLDYIKDKFLEDSKVILIRGSTARKPIRKFSDIDFEVYGKEAKKPYYEIVFINEKPVLISIYFCNYAEGKKARKPENVRVLYGTYTNGLKPDFRKERYDTREKIKRGCQLAVDFLFKYLRTGNKKYLESVQKRI